MGSGYAFGWRARDCGSIGRTAGCNKHMTGQAQPPSPTQKSRVQTPSSSSACPPSMPTPQRCAKLAAHGGGKLPQQWEPHSYLPSLAAAHTQGCFATAPPAGVRPARHTRTQAKLRQQAAPGHRPARRPQAAAGRARPRRAAASAAPPLRRRARRRPRPQTPPPTSPPPPARGARVALSACARAPPPPPALESLRIGSQARQLWSCQW